MLHIKTKASFYIFILENKIESLKERQKLFHRYSNHIKASHLQKRISYLSNHLKFITNE